MDEDLLGSLIELLEATCLERPDLDFTLGDAELAPQSRDAGEVHRMSQTGRHELVDQCSVFWVGPEHQVLTFLGNIGLEIVDLVEIQVVKEFGILHRDGDLAVLEVFNRVPNSGLRTNAITKSSTDDEQKVVVDLAA